MVQPVISTCITWSLTKADSNTSGNFSYPIRILIAAKKIPLVLIERKTTRFQEKIIKYNSFLKREISCKNNKNMFFFFINHVHKNNVHLVCKYSYRKNFIHLKINLCKCFSSIGCLS